MTSDINRIARSPGLGDLGVINWVICAIAAARQRVPRVHLFTTLGQHRRLMWAWLPFSGILLRGGKLARRDTELVILRVAHLRASHYELTHHRRMARAVGLGDDVQQRIFTGASAEGLTGRQRALLSGVDELLQTRTLSDVTAAGLTAHLDRPQLIEFVMLASQYDALATTLAALRVPLDYPQRCEPQ